MEKAGLKTRDIRFFSQKNNAMVCVHSQLACDFARSLEEAEWVESYTAGYALDPVRLGALNRSHIRESYFETAWTSDFVLYRPDGRCAVREICRVEDMQKLAEIEKLELSRRYWSDLNISDWKVIVKTGGFS